MYSIDLSGKKGIVFGVANDRSIAWGIADILAGAGARLALTYQNERLKERVDRLAGTLDGALTIPCDATDDGQIEEAFKQVADAWWKRTVQKLNGSLPVSMVKYWGELMGMAGGHVRQPHINFDESVKAELKQELEAVLEQI